MLESDAINPYPDILGWSALEMPWLRSGFIGRVANVNVRTDRESVMARLAPHHAEILQAVGVDVAKMATAEQIHGADIAVVTSPGRVSGVDALVTDRHSLPIGIYVADCAAVYFADPVRRVIGLAHSGKKGTEGRIAKNTLDTMRDHFGSKPENIVAVISPCIRPPHYEVDFAAMIRAQLTSAGVGHVIDSGICTAAENDSFYSYRLERGETGRMLAFLEIVI